MSDPVEPPEAEPTGRRWLLLIHQLPAKPDYIRVKIRRRLRQLGAVAVKKTVYALPYGDESLEDLEWLCREIEADGGTGIIAEAQFLEGISDEELDAMLETERMDADGVELPRSKSIDTVESGQTWVTREGVNVDRIASAWLIRRFIDPNARFKFVPARGYRKRTGELRFDMFEAEYTHVGEDCTFQTLLRRFGLRDRGLGAIGEVIHDIDCKDDRFNRPETAGTAALVRGIVQTHDGDQDRIGRGSAMLDDLYEFFRKQRQ
jgi:hypothetical protein